MRNSDKLLTALDMSGEVLMLTRILETLEHMDQTLSWMAQDQHRRNVAGQPVVQSQIPHQEER